MSLKMVSSNSWYSGYWNTKPTLNRASRRVFLLVKMFSPSKSTSPEVGVSRPFIICTSVDLPLPVCPMMPVILPSRMTAETSLTA